MVVVRALHLLRLVNEASQKEGNADDHHIQRSNQIQVSIMIYPRISLKYALAQSLGREKVIGEAMVASLRLLAAIDLTRLPSTRILIRNVELDQDPRHVITIIAQGVPHKKGRKKDPNPETVVLVGIVMIGSTVL
jgi:hypothetical protein